jgi:hypothetical protein
MTALGALRAWITRPIGEWILVVLLALQGVNSVQGGVGADRFDRWTYAVATGDVVIGLSALAIAVAIVTRRAWGLPLLWLCSAAMVFTGSVAAWKLGGVPAMAAMGTALLLAFCSAAFIWYGTRRLHAGVTQRLWPALVADHAAAADEFVAAIQDMSPTTWTARRAPDAWSAAEITEHLSRTYAQYAGEARGKNSLRVRVAPVRRFFIRLFVKRRLLAGAIFPRARAPRELRPSSGPPTAADGVAMFRAAGEGCLYDLQTMAMRRPYFRMVHPYFGALPMYEIMQFATQHIRHHRRQLPS